MNLLSCFLLLSSASAFVVTPATKVASTSALSMMDANSFSEAVTLSSSMASSGFVIAETEAWVQPTAAILDPFLNFMSFAMLCRVVLSWYPDRNIAEFPWVIVTLPTQGLLKAVKGIVPPAFGVDITPIFWLAIFTFIHEILLGQQGLFTLKLKYGI